MAVQSVFISSVQSRFEQQREAAALAARSLGLYVIRAEDEPASSASPRRALLDRVAEAEIFLLILGARYGQAGASGLSPTEDEFNEAQRLGRPILVLVQEGELEPAQQAFLERVSAGGWDAGKLYARFADPEDLKLKVVAALSRLVQAAAPDDTAGAQARAQQLATVNRRDAGSGARARVALVPTSGQQLLDALGLERHGLEDALAAAARSSGLVPQSVGISAQISAAGISLVGSEPLDWVPIEIVVHTDGAITAQGPVAAEGTMGGMAISPERLSELLAAAGRFALSAWQEIDRHEQVRQAAVVVAIPNAAYKGFADQTGSSMALGGSVPDTVVAPDPPVAVNRRDLGTSSWVSGVVAAVRRVFLDAGRGGQR